MVGTGYSAHPASWRPGRAAYGRLVKPLMDKVVALTLLLLLLPVIVACAVLVLADLGHPVLFRQTRVGQDGTPFTVLKFRTMRSDRRRRRGSHPRVERRRVHKTEDDPRVSRTGRRLRRWSLDELPQLVNVLRGDMSLVGPRPELPEIVATYPPEARARLAVKPGMTGLWQVTKRGEGLMHEHVHLDVLYAQNQSLRLDLSIMLRTVTCVVTRPGC